VVPVPVVGPMSGELTRAPTEVPVWEPGVSIDVLDPFAPTVLLVPVEPVLVDIPVPSVVEVPGKPGLLVPGIAPVVAAPVPAVPPVVPVVWARAGIAKAAAARIMIRIKNILYLPK
jgi:hypothetical protein